MNEIVCAAKPTCVTGGSNPSYSTNVSGQDVVNYACQFVGNPYVYGGTSLTNGCDCSYFTQACFGHYGISLPRTSYAQRSSGQAVSYANAKAGDILCYAGHVAIYMGNGKIVQRVVSAMVMRHIEILLRFEECYKTNERVIYGKCHI